MTTPASQTLAACRSLGVLVHLCGHSNIIARAPTGTINDQLRDALARDKAGVIALLRRETRLEPACPGSIAERHAIMVANGVAEAEAEAVSLAEFGYANRTDFGDAWCEHIAARVALTERSGAPVTRVAALTLQFTTSDWFKQALGFGWAMPELFGASASGEPVGLVLRLVRATDGSRLQSLDMNRATIVLQNGSTRLFRRLGPEFDSAAPWWMQPASDERKNQLEAA